MSQDYTPARLRELETRLRLVLEYMDDMTPNDALHIAAVQDSAAALRAAADELERWKAFSADQHATLAAREALLKRAMRFVQFDPRANVYGQDRDEVIERAALAAEIAAALGGTDEQ